MDGALLQRGLAPWAKIVIPVLVIISAGAITFYAQTPSRAEVKTELEKTELRVLEAIAVQNNKVEQLSNMVYDLTTSQAVLTERISALVEHLETHE